MGDQRNFVWSGMMIERIYIDNYRTLVNCEINLRAVSLLLGPNSTGKSSVLDLTRTIKRFVGGVGLVSELFPSTNLTRWQSLDEQIFEIDLRTTHGLCRYALRLKHAQDRRRCRVLSEALAVDQKPLFSFADGQIQLFNDLHEPGPKMSYDWNRSGLAAIYARHDNIKLTEFKQRLESTLFLRPCPQIMETDSPEEAEELDLAGLNFPSWYRFIARQDISRQLDLLSELRQVIEGFDSLRLEGPADSTVTLRVLIKPDGAKAPLPFKFGELFDGQRQLIVLHALLFGMSDEKRVLFLDEPDNYLAPREVEPWLTALIDAPGRSISQAIIISHHPEVIDHLAKEKGIWFTRDSAGLTRVETGRADDTTRLRPSEVEARGW
ncbi:MAG: AAA family ATPase [Planctomycetota bacterium]